MKIQANNIEIEVDDQGPANAEPLLLIMGLGMQLVAWPQELVTELIGRGYRVIRFDNRDIGLSQGFDDAGTPNVVATTLRAVMRLPVASPYKLRDMAQDALGVLDALGIRQAHVCGASMGGMIAQHLAAHHPTRVKSLTLVMTTSGASHLPQPSWRVRQALLKKPGSRDLPGVVKHMIDLVHTIGSPGHRPDPVLLRKRLEAAFTRAYRPTGMLRQLVAIVADGDRSAMLSQVKTPTAVIHGADDPLVPPGAANDLVAKIAGATLDMVPGMGHDLPLALLPRLAQGIHTNAQRASSNPATQDRGRQ